MTSFTLTTPEEAKRALPVECELCGGGGAYATSPDPEDLQQCEPCDRKGFIPGELVVPMEPQPEEARLRTGDHRPAGNTWYFLFDGEWTHKDDLAPVIPGEEFEVPSWSNDREIVEHHRVYEAWGLHRGHENLRFVPRSDRTAKKWKGKNVGSWASPETGSQPAAQPTHWKVGVETLLALTVEPVKAKCECPCHDPEKNEADYMGEADCPCDETLYWRIETGPREGHDS